MAGSATCKQKYEVVLSFKVSFVLFGHEKQRELDYLVCSKKKKRGEKKVSSCSTLFCVADPATSPAAHRALGSCFPLRMAGLFTHDVTVNIKLVSLDSCTLLL